MCVSKYMKLINYGKIDKHSFNLCIIAHCEFVDQKIYSQNCAKKIFLSQQQSVPKIGHSKNNGVIDSFKNAI